MTTAENERWRDRVKKEDKITAKFRMKPFQVPKRIWASPVEPHRMDPRLAQSSGLEAFQRYDVNMDGTMDVRELKSVLNDLQIKISDANIVRLQKEMDVNGDGVVSVEEASDWWEKKQKTMSDKLFADPTAKWGSSPSTTSREVGWFIARRAEASPLRRSHEAKWRVPKQSCPETLYSQDYVRLNAAGKSPFSKSEQRGAAPS
mmetsp:Transcript_26932/g.60220  ORF Transcript_26932/g.60220 Transcript_26932/m.60220 type:complete len:203 (+) Transcript_26932:61-669(+)|eukprot:CAMPEP_0172617392 /NCGR_PEP_ID=MMETSP1068-20121228/70229_1 /TAXON_ID=35684 /ORGANISM="Pseudopedinella elastica, Strain CCMP716" /LENGTH=202 /DNA_ID=CAMNT_0013423145 /DNA_START=55 /DNA_END=663 /DNA_ORIENTATION=+